MGINEVTNRFVSRTADTQQKETDENQITKKNDQLGKNEFLKLLVTELQNQDPINPMNDREFISQMAQFSSLEQMENLNKTMENGLQAMVETQSDCGLILAELFSQVMGYNNFNTGMNLLGKEVSYSVEDEEKTGVVQAVKQKDGAFIAVVGEDEVPISEIKEIK